MAASAVIVRPVAAVGERRAPVGLWSAAVAFAIVLLPASTMVAARTAAPAPAPVVSLLQLPLPAQALVSDTLGNGDRAYHVRGFEVSNRTQRLAAEFGRSGVTVRAGGEQLRVSLQGLPAAEPVARANRVEYRRGPVTEWYANGPLGLEQGFTLARPLRRPLQMALTGTLTARLAGRSVAFSAAGEPLLRLRGLHAQDANGRMLPSRFELRGGLLLVHVDERDARYPITVDPFLERAKVFASDGADSDYFGYSVAMSDDTMVVGAFGDDTAADIGAGSAYVFVRSGSVWSQQQKLTASDTAGGDQFGASVAVAGETAVVGANRDATAAGVTGSAYVFVRSGSVWSEQAKLTAADGAGSDEFGVSVALVGETAVIGASGDGTNEIPIAGSAYVFVRTGTVWSQQQKLTASDAGSGDEFGFSVALSAETAVIGAWMDDTTAGAQAGSAYVFVRSGSVWSEQQKLTASDGAPDDFFGSSVAVSGDTAVVGARGDDATAGTFVGSAYVFVRTGSVWGEQQKLTASDGAASDLFGISVAVSGERAVVGSLRGDAPTRVNAGAAYVFTRSGSVWSEQQKLTASDAVDGFEFGISVALSGETVIVGSRYHHTPVADYAGAAYVFEPLCIRDGATVHIDLVAGESVTVLRSGAAIHANGSPCEDATVLNVDVISVDGVAAGSESLTVDLSGGLFEPGLGTEPEPGGTAEIEWVTSSIEGLTIQGTAGADTIRFGSAGVNLNTDADADMTVPDVATATVHAGLGNDVLSGQGAHGADPGKWAQPLFLYGEGNQDKLTGGVDDDTLDGGLGIDTIQQLKTDDGGDTIVGGAGVDTLSYSSRQAGDPLSVTLDGVANDGSVGEGDDVGSDVENVLLGAGNDYFDATAVLVNNVVQGGAGADELHGGGKADQLRGDGGNDLLYGEGGNDILNAIEPETGTSDTLSGGTGTDVCKTDDADVINDC